MIKQIILLLILLLLKGEALENICTNKEEAEYGQEELKAYYIRKERIKYLIKRCQNHDKDSCIVLALEKVHNFHPCSIESDELIEKGINELKEICSRDYVKACFTLAYDLNKDKYFSIACQLNKNYCATNNHKLYKGMDVYNGEFTKPFSVLKKNKDIKSYIKFLENECEKKDSQACWGLSKLYENYTPIIGMVNEWLEHDEDKSMEYRYKSCTSSYNLLGCIPDYETDYIPPKKWLIDRAKKLNFSLPQPKFIPIEDKKIKKKKVNKPIYARSRVIQYRDETLKKEWQINEKSQLGTQKDLWYFEGTTLRICQRLIPKNKMNWRLPLKNELLAVIDLFNENQDYQYYWTSEQSKDDPMDYWVVDVRNGTTHEVYKNNHYSKGCVYVRDLNK